MHYTEEYNGTSSWSINYFTYIKLVEEYLLGGAGTQTAAVIFGGSATPLSPIYR
jgi:hypothetical protein